MQNAPHECRVFCLKGNTRRLLPANTEKPPQSGSFS